jgi:type 1 fimbria pilin
MRPARGWSLPVSDEFFVGYLPMPPATALRMKRMAAAIVVLGASTAAALAIATGPFDRATYEYGKTAAFEGTLRVAPTPTLVAADRTYPLVAEGKHGAAPLIAGLPDQSVRLSGTRILRDGTIMLEVVAGSVMPLGSALTPAARIEDLGSAGLSGEIVDSKCFLGVMNPGRLEVHRACAKRCIAGGIPPMLFTHDAQGNELHVLLVDGNGQPVNDRVLPLVARPVTLEGRLERRDGLHYLYVSGWR